MIWVPFMPEVVKAFDVRLISTVFITWSAFDTMTSKKKLFKPMTYLNDMHGIMGSIVDIDPNNIEKSRNKIIKMYPTVIKQEIWSLVDCLLGPVLILSFPYSEIMDIKRRNFRSGIHVAVLDGTVNSETFTVTERLNRSLLVYSMTNQGIQQSYQVASRFQGNYL